MPPIGAEHKRAVDVHSDQAGEFAHSYQAFEHDPYGSCFTYSRMRLHQALDRLLPPGGELSALDVGCGTGHHMRDLAARGFTVTGVDGSPEMLERAKLLNPQAQLVEADVAQIPFDDSTFDLALCLEVLRYLPDPQTCINEMARVLRPGGTCLATAAPRFSLNGYPLINRVAVAVPVGELIRLRQYFTTPSQLISRFSQAGFCEVEVKGVYTGPINWAEHLAPNQLSRFLRRWEPIDRHLSDGPLRRAVSNMLLVKAVRAA